MFYYASKILSFPLVPSMLLTLFAALGMALALDRRWRTAGTRIAVGAVLAIMIAGLSPLGNILILPLEDRFPRPALDADRAITGIIILGGFEDGRISEARGGLALNEAAERITEAVVLARRLPAAKVVFTGGIATLVADDPSGAPAVRDFLLGVGVEPQRIVIEDRSRTTWENAVFTRRIVQPRAGERWLLVTSAFHMPRSMGVFRHAGFEVLPWPVDYRTKGRGDQWRFFGRIPEGMERIDVAAKEWIGLVAYRVTGRSSALWPAP